VLKHLREHVRLTLLLRLILALPQPHSVRLFKPLVQWQWLW